jgi:hypothetical protein
MGCKSSKYIIKSSKEYGEKFLKNKEFEKAAYQFLLAECYQEASDAYYQAYLASKNKKFLYDCYKAYPNNNQHILEKLAYIEMDDNNFFKAGRNFQELAMESKDNKKAIEYYIKAADCYKCENKPVNTSENIHRAADLLSIEIGDFEKATNYYHYLTNNCQSYLVNNYCFKNILCQLIQDIKKSSFQNTKELINLLITNHFKFHNSSEHIFIENILNAIEKNDLSLFTKEAYDYDKQYKLDGWTTKILLEIKRNIKISEYSLKTHEHCEYSLKTHELTSEYSNWS